MHSKLWVDKGLGLDIALITYDLFSIKTEKYPVESLPGV